MAVRPVRVAVITAGPDANLWEHHRAVALIAAAGAKAVYIAVNDMGVTHPDPLHHWASQHSDQLYHRDFRWAERREANGYRSEYVCWNVSQGGSVDRVARTKEFRGGSSGLLAFDVALNGLECDGAIGCGVRMDGAPNPTNPKSKDGWGSYQRFWGPWERLPEKYRRRMRCFSGRTRELLGAPTRDWIEGLSSI